MIDRFAFTAMTGAKHAMGQLATTTHNMANLQTPGFREMLSMFRAVPVDGANADSRAFVVDSTPGADWSPGSVSPTGNPLDIAIQDQGLFVVRRADGQEAFTRSGKFHLDPQGFLVNSAGLLVLDDRGSEIQVPEGSQEIQIQANGTVRVTLLGQLIDTPIARLKLVNPEPHSLERLPDGLFSSNEYLSSSEDVRVLQGSLEGSNVNAAQAMAQMIAQNRLFDLNIRLVQVAEQNSKTAGILMSLSRA
jgi:flagellar basal-body rod protein FlgF